MARPTTKEQLRTAAAAKYAQLTALVESLTPAQQIAEFAFEGRDRNVRDVVVHLYEWHCLFTEWLRDNAAGESRDFLPAPYNWRTYPQMNVELWKRHQGVTSLGRARAMLEGSHAEVMALVDGYSDEELFTKRHFPWTGTSSLGSYAVSATSSHYDWAMKKLKEHKRTHS